MGSMVTDLVKKNTPLLFFLFCAVVLLFHKSTAAIGCQPHRLLCPAATRYTDRIEIGIAGIDTMSYCFYQFQLLKESKHLAKHLGSPSALPCPEIFSFPAYVRRRK